MLPIPRHLPEIEIMDTKVLIFKPVFELGLWNSWILTLFIVLHPVIMNIIDKALGTGDLSQKMGDVPSAEGKKRHFPIPTLLLFVLFIFSIFLPLRLHTPWLYIGILIYLIGIAMFLSSIITAVKKPLGLVFSQGMYRYSRHPLYLSFLLVFIGISVAAASWLFLLLSLGWMAFPLSQVSVEERGCLETFGADYQEYMQRTPKWLGIPKKQSGP